MRGNQTLEEKHVCNKPGLSPVAKTVHSCPGEQPAGVAFVAINPTGSWVGIVPSTHRQAVSYRHWVPRLGATWLWPRRARVPLQQGLALTRGQHITSHKAFAAPPWVL